MSAPTWVGSTPAHLSFEDVVDGLERLPASRSAALSVVQAAAGPDADAHELAQLVGQDAVLAARLLKLANSAYYGLSGRVLDLRFAVRVLGFLTVRSLAAAAAADAAGDTAMPRAFWTTSTRRAAAASLLAARNGCRKEDAFCAALLADLGFALLHRIDPDNHAILVGRALRDAVPICDLEEEAYGLDHATAAGRVLLAWRFPLEITAAVSAHHDAVDPRSNRLHIVVRGATVLANYLPGSESHDPRDHDQSDLLIAGVERTELSELAEESRALSCAFDSDLG